jgi:hypothetical protein
MVRLIAVAIVCLALGAGGGFLLARTETGGTAAPRPQCRHITYGADGTANPLFCRIADPAVLAYYQRSDPWMFKLGPNATPQQVAAVAQHHLITFPIDCAAYTLASALNGWRFAYTPVPQC